MSGGWTAPRALNQRMHTLKNTGFQRCLKKNTLLEIYATRARCESSACAGRLRTSKYTAYGEEKTKESLGALFLFLIPDKRLEENDFPTVLIAERVLADLL